jgi:threonine synthase
MKTPQLPVNELGKKLGLTTELWFKREDLHHYQSHKGRAIPIMITEYSKRQGFKKFVISSSGNAALAALMSVQTNNKSRPNDPLELTIFVGQKISEKKLSLLKDQVTDSHITIKQVDDPKHAAVQTSTQDKTTKLLRQSTDEIALRAYTDLARELGKIEGLSAVFIPSSSGTTAQGLHAGFKQLGINPQIHVVQTTSCHPLADSFYESQGIAAPPIPQETSLAGAIVDQVAHRKIMVTESIKESNGYAWIINNKELSTCIETVKQTVHLTLSPNSALSVAALQKALAEKRTFNGPVLCLITGN